MRATTTTWCGLAIGLASLLPAAARSQAPTSQAAKAEPTKTERVWQVELDPAGDVDVASGPSMLYVRQATSLAALALEDGREVWSRGVGPGTTLRAAGERLVLVADGMLEAISSASGATKWRREWQAIEPGTPPMTTWQAGQLAVVLGSDVHLLDDAGAVTSSMAFAAPPDLPPLVAGGVVTAVLSNQTLEARDAASGARLWAIPLMAKVLGLATDGNRVYATAANGLLYCARNGQLEWTFDLHAPAAGPPSVDSDQAYVALFDNTLQAFGRKSGTRRWHQALPGRPAGLWLSGSHVIVVQADGVIVTLERASGTETGRIDDWEDARRLDAAGVLPGPAPLVYTVTTGTLRLLSLWRPKL